MYLYPRIIRTYVVTYVCRYICMSLHLYVVTSVCRYICMSLHLYVIAYDKGVANLKLRPFSGILITLNI